MTVKHSKFSNYSVYVGNLHPNVTVQLLNSCFSEVSLVKSARVCRRHEDASHLGYGYVNFFSEEDKEKAKEAMDGYVMFERHIRVEDVAEKGKPKSTDTKQSNVFITNLPSTVSHESLQGVLSQFGTILSIKLPAPSKQISKGMAYVQFSTAEAAGAAIQASKEKVLKIDGSTVVVAPYLTYRQRVKCQEESFTNLYVKNLPSNILTNEDLANMFSPYGNITSARLVKDPMFNRYYGFVNYDTPRAATEARNSLNGVSLGTGKQARLYVSRFQTKSERTASLTKSGTGSAYSCGSTSDGSLEIRNVYVKHLSPEVDEAVLYQIFQAFGPIANTRIMRDSMTKMSRGFGFVTFVHSESAAMAVQNLNGWPLGNRRLYVTLSKPGNAHVPMRSLNGSMPWASFSSDQAPAHVSEAPMPANRAFFQVNPLRKSLSLMV